MRHTCARKFGRREDQIHLPRLRRRKHRVIAEVQHRDLLQLRLLPIVIFVRLHNELLFLLERNHLPRAAADGRRRIALLVGVFRHDAETRRRLEEHRPRLRQRELHLRIRQRTRGSQRRQIHGAAGSLCRLIGEYDVLRRHRRPVRELRIIAQRKDILHPVGRLLDLRRELLHEIVVAVMPHERAVKRIGSPQPPACRRVKALADHVFTDRDNDFPLIGAFILRLLASSAADCEQHQRRHQTHTKLFH